MVEKDLSLFDQRLLKMKMGRYVHPQKHNIKDGDSILVKF